VVISGQELTRTPENEHAKPPAAAKPLQLISPSGSFATPPSAQQIWVPVVHAGPLPRDADHAEHQGTAKQVAEDQRGHPALAARWVIRPPVHEVGRIAGRPHPNPPESLVPPIAPQSRVSGATSNRARNSHNPCPLPGGQLVLSERFDLVFGHNLTMLDEGPAGSASRVIEPLCLVVDAPVRPRYEAWLAASWRRRLPGRDGAADG
jgi:hypothetical protein